MKELSLNILDIAQNSVKAGASVITVDIDEQPVHNRLSIAITDDGCGMSPEFLARVTDPFTTTRTTRPVGLGIPLFKQAAEMTGGSFTITSEPGKGTAVNAVFVYDSIDRMPLGDLPSTFVLLLGSPGDIDWRFSHRLGEGRYDFSVSQLRAEAGDIDTADPAIAAWLTDYFREQEENLYGGISK